MASDTKTILGISPGTKSTGIAIIRDSRLVHWQIHSFPGAWSYRKMKTIILTIEKYLRKNHIEVVAVKVPDVFPTNTGYNQLIGTLNVFCKRKNISIRYYMLSEIKQAFNLSPETKMDVFIESIVNKNPELLPEYQKERRNLNKKYYNKVFEAVAVVQVA